MKENNIFEKLPKVVNIYLFDFLKKQDLKKAKLVNKFFRNVATTVTENRYYGEVFRHNREPIPYSIVTKILSFCNRRELENIKQVNEGFARCVYRVLKDRNYTKEALEISQVFKGSKYYGVSNTMFDKSIKLFKNKDEAQAYTMSNRPDAIVVCLKINFEMFLRVHREKIQEVTKGNHDAKFFEFLEVPVRNCNILSFQIDQGMKHFNALDNQSRKKDKAKNCTIF